MADFMIRFLICNVFISIIIGILFAVKRLLKNKLTSRIQYNLWFLLLGLLTVPFIPIQSAQLLQIFSWVEHFDSTSAVQTGTVSDKTTVFSHPGTTDWMNDFGAAVSQKAPSVIGFLLFLIWILGIASMIFFVLKSMIRFHALKKSAMPLQNSVIFRLYQNCLAEMHITKNIPIYSTAFLKSPVIAGLFKPCIYLPIYLIADYPANDIRYMLLHELQHYKYKDALANCLMNIASVFYWFNPCIWYALKEMKNDREVACDTSVLKMLTKDSYEDYGNTLINFAETVSHTPFPFVTGINGSMEQMKKRILNIAGYQPASFSKNVHSFLIYILIAVFLSGFIPVLSIQAVENNHYFFQEKDKNITYIDLSASFGNNAGSFVLYDTANDSWQIYNKDYAVMRISPVSTYKIYNALFGLESGVISPEQSLIAWNGQHYPYDLWNADQTLDSAMSQSVTWYFQTIDQQIGFPALKEYVQKIGYGNQTVAGNLSSYWGDSTLKISPIEQVELLKKFYTNEFGFSQENIDTVKDAIRLFATNDGTLSGKTGTGEENGINNSGWFIGYIEQGENLYFFATHIQNEELATGAIATELTFSILSDLGLWNLKK